MKIMSINEQSILIYVLVGFIPYFVKKQWAKEKHALEVRALFWSVEYTNWQWTIRVPLIEQLRHAIWIVIMHLRENNHSQE